MRGLHRKMIGGRNSNQRVICQIWPTLDSFEPEFSTGHRGAKIFETSSKGFRRPFERAFSGKILVAVFCLIFQAFLFQP